MPSRQGTARIALTFDMVIGLAFIANYFPIAMLAIALIEFLIRRTDGEWFDLPPNRLAEALKPRSIPSEPTPGWGSHRIKIPDGVISFSDEDPGIQVMFDEFSGSWEEARVIVEEILANIEAATGQRGRIVDL